MPYKKQKAIRSNKKYVIYDLMTDFGLNTQTFLQGCVSGHNRNGLIVYTKKTG